MINQKLLNHTIDLFLLDYTGDKVVAQLILSDYCRYLMSKLDNIKSITTQINTQKRELDSAEKIYKTILTNFNLKIRDVQQTCPHILTTYYPDASGGNSSETICDICGKSL